MTLMTRAYFQQPDWLLHMENILETLNEGVVVVDDNLRIVFANEALLRLTGHERGELLHRALDTVFAPEDLAYLVKRTPSPSSLGDTVMSTTFREKQADAYPRL
jgi:PAS domain S-box-containing protein